MKELRVLIVDDFEMVRKMIRDSLLRIGVTKFTEAVDGVDALEKLNQARASGEPFHVMLLDLNMPRMNGFDVLTEVRSNPHLKTVRTLVVSAEAEKALVTEAIRLGALDYIVKPFSSDIMKQKLERIWNSLKEK